MTPDSVVTLVSSAVENLYAAIAAVTTAVGAISALIAYVFGFNKGKKAAAENTDPKSGRL